MRFPMTDNSHGLLVEIFQVVPRLEGGFKSSPYALTLRNRPGTRGLIHEQHSLPTAMSIGIRN